MKKINKRRLIRQQIWMKADKKRKKGLGKVNK